MTGFKYDGNTLWVKHFADGESHLLGKSLLDLKSAGKHLRQPGQFRKPENSLVRNIAYVHLERVSNFGTTIVQTDLLPEYPTHFTCERNHVVLA